MAESDPRICFKANLIHRTALEYRGKKKGNDFVTVGKKIFVTIQNFKVVL
jgi:hypothetical protein